MGYPPRIIPEPELKTGRGKFAPLCLLEWQAEILPHRLPLCRSLLDCRRRTFGKHREIGDSFVDDLPGDHSALNVIAFEQPGARPALKNSRDLPAESNAVAYPHVHAISPGRRGSAERRVGKECVVTCGCRM